MKLFKRNLLARAVPPPIPAPPSEDIQPLNDGRKRKTIMVVDDDLVVLKTLSLTLKSKGYKVVTAVDGAEAIGRMREDKPDMMLVDVSLPLEVNSEWDGFQIAQWLRYVNGALPTVMISGSDKPEYKKQAAALGAEAFMTKPLDNKLLLGTIGKALGLESTVPTLMLVA